MKRAVFLGWLIVCGLAIRPTAQSKIPRFEFDPTFPQMPAGKVFGDVSSVTTDARNHVWVIHRPRTVEGVNGLMNLVGVPMWIGSGIFFSRERFPDALQPLLRALPLTALNDALRGLMLEGRALSTLGIEIGVLAAWAVVAFVVAVAVFRWD